MTDTITSSAEKRALSVEEFTAGYGVGRTTVYEQIAAGRLKARKFGRRTIIAREDAEAWLNALPSLPTATAA